jgi:hypothetical protein
MRLRTLAAGLVAVLGALAGALAGGLGAGPAVALAQPSGSFTITACSPGTSAGGWTVVNPFAGTQNPPDTAGNQCGNGTPADGPNDTITDIGALFGEDSIGSTNFVPGPPAPDNEAGWQLSAPAGITITSISYYASFATATGAIGWTAGLQVDGQPYAATCNQNLSQTTSCDCRTNPSPCQVLNMQTPIIESNLSAGSLFFGVSCNPTMGLTQCGPGGTQHDAQADMYSAKVTLQEQGGPIIQQEGGPLWGGGPVWGTEPVTFNGSDPSGIAQVYVQGSNGTVQSTPQSCSYSQIQACPELPNGQVQVNTAQLPDGSDQISLVLANAAGNTTAVQGPAVVVDNNGPPAPTSLTATAASRSSNAINLAWSNPSNPPEPVQTAWAQLCASSCGTAIQLTPSGGAQITAPAAGAYTLRLWLTDTAGRGGSGNAATTTVTVPAATTPTTTVTTTVPTPTPKPVFKVKRSTWTHGRLMLVITGLPRGDKLQITLSYRHARRRIVTTNRSRITVKTTRPSKAVLEALKGKRRHGATVTLTKFPNR